MTDVDLPMSFMIDEVPIKRVMKQVDLFERARRGEKIVRTLKDPVITPGMPGSGPQMHREIVDQIIKNKLKKLVKSNATKVNKYRYLKS